MFNLRMTYILWFLIQLIRQLFMQALKRCDRVATREKPGAVSARNRQPGRSVPGCVGATDWDDGGGILLRTVVKGGGKFSNLCDVTIDPVDPNRLYAAGFSLLRGIAPTRENTGRGFPDSTSNGRTA